MTQTITTTTVSLKNFLDAMTRAGFDQSLMTLAMGAQKRAESLMRESMIEPAPGTSALEVMCADHRHAFESYLEEQIRILSMMAHNGMKIGPEGEPRAVVLGLGLDCGDVVIGLAEDDAVEWTLKYL
jgi:hypothetical protein